MSPLFFIFLLIIISIVVLSRVFSRNALIKRKLKKAYSRKISAFKDGEVAKVVGEVEFVDEPLIAPLSKRKCASYYVKIEQKVSSGKNSQWKTIIEREETSRYVLREGDAVAYVNPEYVKSYIFQDEYFSSGFLNDASDELEAYLGENGYSSEGMFGINKTMRYKEGVLEENEEVAVLGRGIWKDASKLNLPEKLGRVLELSSYNDEAVYLSDDWSTIKFNDKPAATSKTESLKRHMPEIGTKKSERKEMKEPAKINPPKIERTRYASGRKKKISKTRYRK